MIACLIVSAMITLTIKTTTSEVAQRRELPGHEGAGDSYSASRISAV
jgi:hypothetical protein